MAYLENKLDLGRVLGVRKFDIRRVIEDPAGHRETVLSTFNRLSKQPRDRSAEANVIKLFTAVTTSVKIIGKYAASGVYYEKRFITLAHVANIIKLFTAVITPLAAYFSMILTQLRQ